MVSVIRTILPVRGLLLASLLMIAVFSSGCGLKGDLYLPDRQAETQNQPDSEQPSDDLEDDDATRP